MGAVIVENRQTIAVESGIKHYRLSAQDSAAAALHAERAGATTAYTVASDRYVGFLNAAGEVVMYLAKTYLHLTPRAAWLPSGAALHEGGLERGGVQVPLSGWEGPRNVAGAAAPASERVGEVCTSCWVAKPVTGVCDTCDA
jgi:hypothetical protein